MTKSKSKKAPKAQMWDTMDYTIITGATRDEVAQKFQVNNKMAELLGAENPFETAFGERMAEGSTLGMTQEERDSWMAGMAAMIA